MIYNYNGVDNGLRIRAYYDNGWHAEGQYCQLNWIYNPNGKDNGLIIDVYEQGSQWIAEVTNNDMDHWQELRLHYSCRTIDEVTEWAIDYADGERLIFSD